MKKGHTIYQFLQKALEVLRTEFTELRTVTADQLMYVKEDLIIPQTNTFYDFIVTKVILDVFLILNLGRVAFDNLIRHFFCPCAFGYILNIALMFL